MRLLMLTLSLVMIGAAVALADPYGPPYAVTDMAPFCATCHASASPAQLQGLPADVAASETIDGKHLSRIKTDPAYRDLSPADREQLIAAIKWVDEQASVTIKAPFQARRNSQIEVTVVTRGGAGPVVGVSLVDSAIRYQARPISSSGFKVVAPALVAGPERGARGQGGGHPPPRHGAGDTTRRVTGPQRGPGAKSGAGSRLTKAA